MEQNQQVAGGKSIVRRSEEEIQRLLNEQEQSGFTVKEYCEMYDIVEQTFYGWLKRYRSKAAEEVKDLPAVPGGFCQHRNSPNAGPRTAATLCGSREYKAL